MDIDSAVSRLHALGCYVSRSWAAAQGAASAEALYAAVLGADFHAAGVLERGALGEAACAALLTDASADGQGMQSAGRVAGPCVVQVDLVLDVGAPRGPERFVAGGAGTASPVRGALKLVCFDGRRTLAAVEKRPLFARAGGGVPVPGAKVLLRGVRVRRGVLVLEPGTVALLGGGVPARAAAVRRLRADEDARVNRRRGTTSGNNSNAAPSSESAPVALCPPRSAPLVVVGSQHRQPSSQKGAVVVVPAAAAPAAAQPVSHVEEEPQHKEEEAGELDADSQEMVERLLREFTEQEAASAQPSEEWNSNSSSNGRSNNDCNNGDVVLVSASPPLDALEPPPASLPAAQAAAVQPQPEPEPEPETNFGTVEEALEAKEGGAPVTVKAVLTSVVSSLECAGGAFRLDIRIDDGRAAAVVTLGTRVLEPLLGTTPGAYRTLDADSAAAQRVCARLQAALEALEGLFTLARRGGRLCATAVAPVSPAYHAHLPARVAARPAPTVPLVATLTRAMQ